MGGQVPDDSVAARDWAIAAGQLGRTPYELTAIAARCPFGYPAVLESPPLVAGRIPNPNLLYLSCPTLVKLVSRAEAQGGIKRLRASARSDASLRVLLLRVTHLYRERREALARDCLPEAGESAKNLPPVLVAGIGGPEEPEAASCLHAYAAALLAVTQGWPASSHGRGGALGGSGDPPHGRGDAPDSGRVDSVRAVWQRFLPPIEDCWCTDARCARWEQCTRRAAIDVGTISVRFLVADVAHGHLRVIRRAAEVTHLGEGLTPGGPLGEGACCRTAEAVRRYVEEARRLGAEEIVLAGTSATREAADGSRFIAALGIEHCLTAAVLSGQREAELAYAGVRSDLQGDLVVMDIGGGSTELIAAEAQGKVVAVSLQVGSSRATNRWINGDPPSAEEIGAAYEEAGACFAGVVCQFGPRGGRRLVGVGGTVTTLAALDAGLQEYDPDQVHGRELCLGGVRDLLDRLAGLTCEERATLACVQPGRAPVLPAGAAIVLAAMETLGYNRLTVSERDLLDGLVLEGL